MRTGPYSARTRLLVLTELMARSLKLFISSTNRKAKLAEQSALKSSGLLSLMLKSKPACPTCSTKV